MVQDQQGLIFPTCRQVTPIPATGVVGLQSTFQINKLLDIVHEHKKVKDNTLFCPEHHQRELELYCETCEKLICFQCTIKDHNGHDYNLVREVFETHKEEIMASLNPAEEQLAEVGQTLEQIDASYRAIFDQQAILEGHIHNSVQQLYEAIEVRTMELLSKVRRQLTEEKFKSLVAHRIQMEAIRTQLSSYLDMVKEGIRGGGTGQETNHHETGRGVDHSIPIRITSTFYRSLC